MKNLENFLTEIEGTFFEQILDVQLREIKDKIRSEDAIVGEASLFEKKCFLFYKDHYPSNELQSQALVALSIMRLFILKRFNLQYKDVSNIWIRESDTIVIDNEKKLG